MDQQGEPADRFGSGTYCPRQSEGVSLFDRGEGACENRYLLLHETTGRTLQIDDADKCIWDMFDGKTTVHDICIRYLNEHEALVQTRMITLLQALSMRGMLTEAPEVLQPESIQKKGLQLLIFTHLGRIPLPGTQLIIQLVGSVLRPLNLSHPFMMILFLLPAVAGIAYVQPSHFAKYPIFHLSGSYSLPIGNWELTDSLTNGILLLLTMHLLCSLVKEILRSSVAHSFIRRAVPLRVTFHYGLPCFVSDAPGRLALPPRKRLVAAVSGLVFELAAALAIMLALPHIDSALASELLTKLALVLYVRCFFHLSPSNGSDLHNILEEWSDLPDFRRRSFRFLRHHLVDTFFSDRLMSRAQRLFFFHNICTLVWMIFAAKFTMDLLDTHHDLVHDMLATYRTRSATSIVIITAIAAPILISILLSLGWAIFVLISWIYSRRAMRKPGNILLTVWGTLAAILAFTFTVEKLGHYGPPVTKELFFIANFLVLVGGIIVCRNNLRREAFGYTRRKLQFMLALFLLGLLSLLTNRWQSDSMLGGAFLGLMTLLIPIYLCYVLAKELRPLGYWRTRYALPQLSMTLGIIMLGLFALVRIAGLYFGGEFPEFPICTFVCHACIVAGLAAWVAGMKHVHLYRKGLAIEESYSETRGLISVGNHIIHQLGQISIDHFGIRAVRRLEREMADNVPGRSFSFDEPFFPTKLDPTEVGRLYRDMLETIHDTLAKRYSGQFAKAALKEAFRTVRWRGKRLMETYILPTTPWAGQFAAEAEFPENERSQRLQNISIFGELTDPQLERLVDNLQLFIYQPGDHIITQGQRGEACHILVSGDAKVVEHDTAEGEQILAILHEGDFVGETALLGNVRQTADIIAMSEVRTLALHKRDFDALSRRIPELTNLITQRLQSLHDLMRIPLFNEIPTNLLRGILSRVRTASLDTGTDIIREGDKGSSFYLIKRGKVAVTQDGKELQTLAAGDYFGELALLHNVPRTATVTCKELCEFLIIDADDFNNLLSGSALFSGNLRQVGDQRNG